ncbi:hypothetical protein [uncultured Collinsella sp.]|uniref:hypothetical protein n=1 Tax=uncultured Collinsella sp. TaxID=165190 RepID=UPI0025DDD512|nr:hypothetical protein [uncultured Collinsella sp.]
MDMKTVGIVVMVVALAFTIYMEVQKRATFAKLETYLREGDLENYLKVLDRPLTNVLYPKYNVLFMRLNALLAMDDAEKTAAVIREMGSLKMNDEQRIALAVKAFTFYVEIEDELHAREVLEYLEANGDESMAKASRRTYDIFLKGSHAYINEMESALSDASGVEEALLCQMLAIQYDNKGDKDRSASYRERAERSLDAAVSK